MSTDISEGAIRSFSEVQKLYLHKTAVVNTSEDLEYLSHILHANVESIDCVRIAYIYQPEPIIRFTNSLAIDSQVRTLSLYGTEMGTRGMVALSKALMINTSIQSLKIEQESSVGVDGWIALAQSFETNCSVRKLCLFENRGLPTVLMSFFNYTPPIISDDFVNALAHALKHSNNSLAFLELGIISDRALDDIAKAVRNNFCLLECVLCVENIGKLLNPVITKCLNRNRGLWKYKSQKVIISTQGVSVPIATLIVDFVFN